MHSIIIIKAALTERPIHIVRSRKKDDSKTTFQRTQKYMEKCIEIVLLY